jgi:hypothetical protein
MSDIIKNKVAESGLITLDLETFYPSEEIIAFDLREHLFMGMILKEKDFRAALQGMDWEQYRNNNVAVFCSADAIIPLWAYMLVATGLSGIAKRVFSGNTEDMRKQMLAESIRSMDTTPFEDKRVIVKGCGDLPIGEFAFVEISLKLVPVVRSLMYGEPCSTVPVYKKK